MENSVAKACKTVSVILFIVGVIGSCVLGDKFPMQDPEFTMIYHPMFNYILCISGVLVSAIQGLLMYALGEIIQQLSLSNDNISRLCSKQEKEQA